MFTIPELPHPGYIVFFYHMYSLYLAASHFLKDYDCLGSVLEDYD